MKLFLYILKDYFKYVFAVIFLCTFLFVLFDFIHKTTRYFSEYNPPFHLIVKMYLLMLPANMTQAVPIASLLGSVITMVLLSRTNEITAMRAVGMSPIQLAAPLAAGGFILSLTTFLMGEFVLPKAAQTLHLVKDVQIEKESMSDIARGVQWARKDNLLVNFREFDIETSKIFDIKIIEVRSNFKPIKLIEVPQANYLTASGEWELKSPRVTLFNSNTTIDRIEYPETLITKLPFDPSRIKRDRRETNELSAKELRDNIRRGEKTGMNTAAYKVDFHLKYSYPLAAFVVSMIGLQFGFRSERKTETARGVVIAFVIGISYWFVLNALRAVGRRGDVDPLIVAWVPNIFMLIIVYFMSIRPRKN